MKYKDIDKITQVIISSGIGTITQRIAMVQRVIDWHEKTKLSSTALPTKADP